MKNRMTSLVLLLLAAFDLSAEERIAERTYISTDRDVYVAGDMVWCSAFCVDANHGGTLSDLSSVAYIELHSTEGMVQNARIALIDGRGAGNFRLESNLPTGNYKIVAYTAQNRNETGYEFDNAATKTISVFNVFTNERSGEVEVVTEGEYKSLPQGTPETTGNFRIETGAVDGKTIPVSIRSDKAASVSISIRHEDGIINPDRRTVVDFVEMVSGKVTPMFENKVIPEVEGEIIKGHVTGTDSHILAGLEGKFAFISAPTNKSDVYSAVIDDNAEVLFFTGNIYGDKELVCEIEGIDSTLNCHIELESPYVGCKVSSIVPLKMGDFLKGDLEKRGISMQIERSFSIDTLFDYLPVRDNVLFEEDGIKYILDDYTRFPSMEEVLNEFVSQLRPRMNGGKRDIQVLLRDNYKNSEYSKGSSLMMLDGVPVFDQEKIFRYDPLLVESINIYPNTHYIGSRAFEGIANFVTYKRNLPSLKFNGNVRVINYQGVMVPTASIRGKNDVGDGYPDYRQTVYWHPITNLEGGSHKDFHCPVPDYSGRFSIVVEGLTSDGEPIYQQLSFEL